MASNMEDVTRSLVERGLALVVTTKLRAKEVALEMICSTCRVTTWDCLDAVMLETRFSDSWNCVSSPIICFCILAS